VLVLHEAMPLGRLAGFVLVWIALLMLVGESLLVLRRTRRVPGVLSSPLPEG